jgi:3-oxoadipate enol-lactonase
MTFARTDDATRLWYAVHESAADQPADSQPAGRQPETRRHPIVLIAGQSVSHEGWAPVLEQFSRRHRVLVFDHRGVGASDAVFPAEFSTRDFARDVVAILDSAGIDRAHVYGHSMGGRIAQWLAADSPERVAGLTLGGTTVGDAHGATRLPAATQALISGDIDALLRLFYSPAWLAANRDAAAMLGAAPRTSEARRKHFAASTGHNGWEAIGRIRAPTLVIHGTADELAVPENARILASGIPGAELMLIDGARHGYFVENPETNDAVLDFFDRVDARG